MGNHIVDHFFGHGLVDLLTSQSDRVGCPDIGSRCHGRNIGRNGDHYPGRSGPGAARRHIDDHRHPTAEYIHYNDSHRLGQPAGCIQPDNDTGDTIIGSLFDSTLDKVGNARADGTGDINDINLVIP